jgi:hypothetical protein
MSAVSERLCHSLLAVADEQVVVDLLIDGASSSDLPKPKIPPSRALALRYVKKNVKKAAAIAASTDDPEILARYSKDPRVTIRRLVAANPATDPITREYLFTWGVGHDREVTEAAMAYLPELALAAFHSEEFRPQNGYYTDSYWLSLARAVGASADPDVVWDAWRISPKARINLAPQIYAYQPGDVTLTQALQATEDDERAELLCAVIRNAREITIELVGLCHQFNSTETSERLGYAEVAETCFDRKTVMSANVALDALRRPSDPVLRHLAATTKNTKVMMRILEIGCAAANEALAKRLRVKGNKIPPRVTFALGRALVNAGPHEHSSISSYLFAGRNADLDCIVPLLRFGSPRSTENWLHGKASVHPRPGDIADLMANPGTAFTPERGYGVVRLDPNSPEQLETFVEMPWADELVDALAGGFFTGLANCNVYHDGVLNYVYGRVMRAFGPDRQAWEVFLSLVADWTKSFSELIETVSTLTGIEPETTPVPDAVVEDVQPDTLFDYDELTALTEA